MGSVQGFRGGCAVMRENGREVEGACSSGTQKEKTQIVRQKSNSNHRRVDKRNTKAQKNRCESFSLKNGLVGFNSTAGGSNFFGLYGLKTDAFDITQHSNEVSLEELLHRNDKCPVIPKDKGKKVGKINTTLLNSVKKACSILQAQKVLQTKKHAETDNSCIQTTSAGVLNPSSASVKTDEDKADSCSVDLPSSETEKVQESADGVDALSIADSPLYQPKDILERLALPPPKDLDLLFSEASKSSSSSKNNTDSRLSKAGAHRTGVPPFPWSHSFSGHNRLNSDSVKLSFSRTTCHGKWVKVKYSDDLHRGSSDFLDDFDTLKFDESLVPKVNNSEEGMGNESISMIRVLSSSRACSTKKVCSGEASHTFTAAQTLCDMATIASMENPLSMLQKTSMKACKFKTREKMLDAPKSTGKVGDDGFPSKKLKISTNDHVDSDRKRPSISRFSSFKSPPPRKVFRDSFGGADSSYSMNFVKTSYMMKPPRGSADRPSSSSNSGQQKHKKVVPMKWTQPGS